MVKTMSESALTAKAIRKELKESFSSIKFSVRSSNFSMGDSVDVGWTNGPTIEAVDNIINKYQYGHFNGMEDIYENSNNRSDIPQAKFVSSSRKISLEIYEEAFKHAKEYLACFEKTPSLDSWGKQFEGTARNYLWRYLRKADLTDGYKKEFLN